MTITKGHNYLQKLMRNNPNLDLVKVNAYAKIWFNSINSFPRYWAELKITRQSAQWGIVYPRPELPPLFKEHNVALTLEMAIVCYML